MRALWFDGTLQRRDDLPTPSPLPHEALIRTRLVGICNTDLEIVRGYGGFMGVPGHEFVGEVVRADDAPGMVGRRVVGEINCYCGQCPTCLGGERTHCPHRSTLGIHGRHGAMAEFFTLHSRVLHPVPDEIPDRAAVFVEPLAAACRILEQVHVRPRHRVVVLGDGKLGLLIAQVLQLTGCNLLVAGRHARKLSILAARGIPTQLVTESTETGIEPGADIVIEATGSPAGFATALSLVRPGGTLVLKSTFHGETAFDSSRIVVDEITLMGSRCGPLAPALRLLAQGQVDVTALIEDTFSLNDGLAAFRRAASGALKVLISPTNR